MQPGLYRRRALLPVEAVRYAAGDERAVAVWAGASSWRLAPTGELILYGQAGSVVLQAGDWLARERDGLARYSAEQFAARFETAVGT